MAASSNGVWLSPVVQGKDQHGIMGCMQNHNFGNNTSVPVTGASLNSGSFLSNNTVNAAPPPMPQVPNHSVVGMSGNQTF